MNSTLSQILSDGAENLGVHLTPEAIQKFEIYYRLLEDRGRFLNLTAISGRVETAQLHFLDSLALLNVAGFADFSRVIDVGSGAGLPGVPLRIVQQTLDLTLLDATFKRVDFLSELCSKLEIEAACVHGRAEEIASETQYREAYDYAVSRAVARLNVLVELCLPFVKIGGTFIAMKAHDADEEIFGAAKAIKTLGGVVEKSIDYNILDTDITRRAVLIRKVDETPPEYPRRFAKIKKSPL